MLFSLRVHLDIKCSEKLVPLNSIIWSICHSPNRRSFCVMYDVVAYRVFVCLSADESVSVYRLEPSTQIALLLIILYVFVATGICCSWRPWRRQHRSRVVRGRPESVEGQGRPLFYSEVIEWNLCLASCWQQKMLFGYAGVDFVLLLIWRRVKGSAFRNSSNSQQQINTFWKYFTQYTKTPSEILNCGH